VGGAGCEVEVVVEDAEEAYAHEKANPTAKTLNPKPRAPTLQPKP